jgi:phosphatidate cytidylyltransferase
MGSLVKRVLTALVAIPVLLFITFWDVSTLPFKLVAVGGLVLALLEYLQLAYEDQIKPQRTEGILSLVIILLPFVDKTVFQWAPAVSVMAVLFVLNLSFLWSQRTIKRMIVTVSVTFFGVAYFGFFGSYFFCLREASNGAWLMLLLYISTWAYDTGGYFIGGRWGKHKLAPQVSPKKSWEGCFGGAALSFVGLFLLWKFFPTHYQMFDLIDVVVLAILLSFFGQVGDLVESVMKRSLSAKDSGSLIPGHGGIFDRIDSLLFNAPVLFFYLILVKHFQF